jgi:hypothetical protein
MARKTDWPEYPVGYSPYIQLQKIALTDNTITIAVIP